MEREIAQNSFQPFDVLVLDAFSGDAIPVHLLTKEAFELYFKCLAPDGIIAVHMSSRHVNLEPVLHAVVEEFPVEGRMTFSIEKEPFKSNIWMLFSAQHQMLEIEGLDQIGQGQPSGESPVFWTDDYSSLLPLIHP
jgi:spermidine synthase